MSSFRGSCLCGSVQFVVEGPLKGVGQCHCSRCRKASGAAGNAVMIVARDRFRWIEGERNTTTFTLPNGWSVRRCQKCGSPLPQSHDGERIWVAAGLMDEPIGTDTKIHIFCGSRADWDRPSDDVRYYHAAPGAEPADSKKAKA